MVIASSRAAGGDYYFPSITHIAYSDETIQALLEKNLPLIIKKPRVRISLQGL
jgi:hypothetical protein